MGTLGVSFFVLCSQGGLWYGVLQGRLLVGGLPSAHPEGKGLPLYTGIKSLADFVVVYSKPLVLHSHLG